MKEQPISISVAIPLDLLPEIEDYAAQHKDEAQVEYKEMPKSGEPPLGCDPITGAAIGWFVLKFAGGLAAKVAVGVLTKVIYDKLKDRWGKKPVEVRLTTGETVEMDLQQPPDEKMLEEKLKESR
jgi:hypothetical protein